MALAEIRRSPTDRGEGRALWRQVFGTIKEESNRPVRPVRGSYAMSATTEASQKRLVQALQSMAPGGWSDDRWEQTKHFTGVVYTAVHRLATQWQQSEFQVFAKDPHVAEGKRPVTPEDKPVGDRLHAPYDLVRLLERPNRQDSWGRFMYRTAQQKILTGTALTWMLPNELGVPMALYSIPTAIAIPQPAINPDFPDGFYRIQPVYPYGPFSSYPTPNTAVGAPIPAQWMLRIQFPHPLLRYDGYSPLTGIRLHLDEMEAIDRSRWYSMKRSINPSAVLNFKEMDGVVPLDNAEIRRIHAEWELQFQGPENHGRLIVGTPGGEFGAWGGKVSEMDYQDGWSQIVDFCLAAFGITKPAAGMTDDASYSTLFATLKQVHLMTVKPDLDDVASELTHTLGPHFGEGLIVEVRCGRIDDHEIRRSKLEQLITGKAITKNELRRELDMPLVQEEWGKEIAGEVSAGEARLEMAREGLGDPGAVDKAGLRPPQAGVEGPKSPDEQAAEKERPKPGPLGRGSLGPRKNLKGLGSWRRKSFYQLTREALANGHP